jgi:predicted TIM-barrel fold metal-dependent hydrolase
MGLKKSTPWGDIEVADAHLHFFSPAFFEAVKKEKGTPDVAAQLGWDEPSSPESLADRWIAEMDRHHITRAMLIASIPNDTFSVGAAVARHPERFGAVYMTNATSPSADLKFQSAWREDGVRGVFLFPSMHRYSLHDRHARSLIEVVAGHPGAFVYVHCGALSVGFRKKLGLPCRFDTQYSNPVDLHELVADFPRINFVIPHFGAGFFREALMVADMCPNVYFDTSSSNHWMAWQPGNLSLTDVFRQALNVVGSKRLLFGSDSSFLPRGWVSKVFDDQVRALSELGADADAARAIFGGNLTRLLS